MLSSDYWRNEVIGEVFKLVATASMPYPDGFLTTATALQALKPHVKKLSRDGLLARDRSYKMWLDEQAQAGYGAMHRTTK